MEKDIKKKLQFFDTNPRLKVLFLLLLRAEGFRKSDDLAESLGVTARTIKSDMKELKVQLQELDLELVSKQSKGYCLMIKQPDLEYQLKEYFQIYRAETIDSEFTTRVQYMVRRLLTSSHSVKSEQIQNELCMNFNNSLNREMNETRKFLADYHLKLVMQPHYGLTVKGKNYSKVFCLVRSYKYFSKMTEPEFHLAAFQELYHCEEDEKEEIRRIFLKTLAGSRIVFSDIYVERFLIHLIYFRNKELLHIKMDLQLPETDFDPKITDEYILIHELIQKLKNQMDGFAFSEEIIIFLTYVAITSTDLYRFRDCAVENYGELTVLAEQTRKFILMKFSDYLQINMFDDYTCMKDLLKIMIPVSMKMVLGISDDVDLGFYDMRYMEEKPIIKLYTEKLCGEFFEQFQYHFSNREKHLIFQTLLGMVNRIQLSHRKLRLAIIAIDGRLSTQQLKFNLQRYFSEYIERIETKVLYELEFMEHPSYDYYLCMEYGKNLNIPYTPIYYANEKMAESEYVDSLNHVFFDAFRYDEVLPKISCSQIDDRYRFGAFPMEELLQEGISYEMFSLGNRKEIKVCFSFKSNIERFQILSFTNQEDITIHGEKKFVIIDLVIAENQQKLKMILNVIQRLAEKPEIIYKPELNSYKEFSSTVMQYMYL